MPDTDKKLLSSFAKLYPNPRSELNFSSEYQLIVAVMLSAQCTDKKVNEVIPTLFKKYGTFRALKSAKVTDVAQIIRPINYFKTKSKNLVSMAKLVEDQFSGQLPKTHADLITLPGVGQKTANVIQSELGTSPTFPVDTHVFRVSKRLGLAKANTPEKVEEELKVRFDSRHWRNLHHWLIFHGRRVCKARNPLCASCSLAPICPSKKNYIKV